MDSPLSLLVHSHGCQEKTMMLLDWAALKHFQKYGTSDKWGDPDKLDAMLLMKVDDLRDSIGQPIHVTSGYRSGDTKEHGRGLALDIVCPGISLLDFWIEAERYAFPGLGVYSHWHWDGMVTGGLHVDQRMLGLRIGSHDTEFRGKRWFAFKNENGVQVYTTLTKENLKKWGVL